VVPASWEINKYKVEVASSGKIFMLNFMKIYQFVQNLLMRREG
jgi:hypothetical protein